MVRIAVTGGIACGKSLVGSLLENSGLAVCDVDDIARGLLVPGEAVFGEVVGSFGKGILMPDGTIDRQSLGRAVFADPRKLGLLNGLVHPEAKRRWEAWLAGPALSRGKAAVIVPLLFEVGEGDGWDAIVSVGSPQSDQVTRLQQRGLTRDEAIARIRSQMSLREKERLADYVIRNEGSKHLLKEQTMMVLASIPEKSNGRQKQQLRAAFRSATATLAVEKERRRSTEAEDEARYPGCRGRRSADRRCAAGPAGAKRKRRTGSEPLRSAGEVRAGAE